MKKEVVTYDEQFYFPPMPPGQPSIVAQHHNLTSIEETIFQIFGKESVYKILQIQKWMQLCFRKTVLLLLLFFHRIA